MSESNEIANRSANISQRNYGNPQSDTVTSSGKLHHRAPLELDIAGVRHRIIPQTRTLALQTRVDTMHHYLPMDLDHLVIQLPRLWSHWELVYRNQSIHSMLYWQHDCHHLETGRKNLDKNPRTLRKQDLCMKVLFSIGTSMFNSN